MAQARRPGRGWWRMLLDQYGAADVLVPEAALHQLWPGGPVRARFIARHGPDGEVIATFDLTAENGDALPAMLDEGVRRIDEAYSGALQIGRLQADPSLVAPAPEPLPEEVTTDEAVTEVSAMTPMASFTIQVDTPDAAALNQAEAAIRAVPGVRSSTTTSLALGGLSVMRIGFDGDIAALKLALSARGWRVEEGGGALRIRRQAAPVAPPPDQATGQPPR